MACVFLREATVQFCQSAPISKALRHEAIDAASERCTRPEHVLCPYAVDRAREEAPAARCPSFAEREVEYCAAAAPPKFVPHASVLPSRCGTDAHRYCELFLERTRRQPADAATSAAHSTGGAVETIDGIPLPLGLAYTTNHLWVDRGVDGTCTIGVDGFLVRVIGRADGVSFVPSRGEGHPFAVLRVAGLELPLVFAGRLDSMEINHSLHAQPGRLSSDPFGSGWLFEGYCRDGLGAENDPARRLVRGAGAVAWMRREVDRLSMHVRRMTEQERVEGLTAAADGGTFAFGLARALRHEDALRLLAEFFPVAAPAAADRASA